MRAPKTDEAARPQGEIAASLRQGAATTTQRFPAWLIGHALDHHHEQYTAFIPSAQPAHAPAIQVITNLDRPAEPQELRLNMHSPLRTCMSLQRREVNAEIDGVSFSKITKQASFYLRC
jgi:hypothetical protein